MITKIETAYHSLVLPGQLYEAADGFFLRMSCCVTHSFKFLPTRTNLSVIVHGDAPQLDQSNAKSPIGQLSRHAPFEDYVVSRIEGRAHFIRSSNKCLLRYDLEYFMAVPSVQA